MLYNVGIIGATGAVGQELIRILEERDFPVKKLIPMATERSAGKKITFLGEEHEVILTNPSLFSDMDILFVAAGTSVSKELVPLAVNEGVIVIDKSNAFRMDPSVPLVVPGVNDDHLHNHKGILASPNCSTIQLVAALKPIQDKYGLNKVVVSTYQSVSGTGAAAMTELEEQTRKLSLGEEIEPAIYPKQIAFNLIPHIDAFEDNGFTGEEMKMINETRKILAEPNLAITATTVRVPVMISHSEAVYIETDKDFSIAELISLLKNTEGLLVDEPTQYTTPLDAMGTDEVYISRIRKDIANEKALWLWVVADNLRKGAATNAIMIAESLINEKLL